MVGKLKNQNLMNSTLLIVTAKHAHSPIDPHQVVKIKGNSPAHILHSFLPASEDPTGNDIGPTEDDISLLWLANPDLTASAVALLEANTPPDGVGGIFPGPAPPTMVYNPALAPTAH